MKLRDRAWPFFAFAFLLYVPSIAFDYALDDRAVTFQNKFVTDGFAGFGRILTTFYWAGFWNANAGLFRPLSLLLFASEWQLFPQQPHVAHAINVLLYATCAALLYRTLRDLFRGTSPAISVVATLVWIAHPAHTEVVANIKSADELLSVLFFLLMIRARSAVTAAVFFFLALLSKEGAVLFAPVVLLALVLFRGARGRKLLTFAAALCVPLAIWLAWHTAVVRATPVIAYRYVDNSLLAAPNLPSRIATAIQMQGRYLIKAVFGYPLAYDASFNQIPNVSPFDAGAIVSLLICAALIVVALMRIRATPILSFGILTYFVLFALTSNVFLLIGATMADRFLFAPTIGFAIAAGWLLAKRPQLTAVIVVVYAFETLARTPAWRSDATLFETDVGNAPRSARVHDNYGTLLMNDAFTTTDEPRHKARLIDVAFEQFSIAAAIDSLDYGAQFSLGQLEYHRGHYPQSAAWSAKAIDTYHRLGAAPPDPSLYLNLADAYLMAARYDDAIAALTEAEKRWPGDARIAIKLGNANVGKRDFNAAAAEFERAVRLDPNSIEAWDKLANVSGMRGDLKRAQEAFGREAELRAH